jgi:mRNA interferase HigB
MRFADTLAGHRTQSAVRAALQAWFQEAERASWRKATDVKKSYATASIMSAERVVFNIKGNDYRLVATVDYRRQIVHIKWIGSHAEYDKIDARTIQYGD